MMMECVRAPRFGAVGVGGVVSPTVPKQAVKFPVRALVVNILHISKHGIKI